LPFIDTVALSIFKLSVPFPTDHTCKIMYPIQAGLYVIGVCACEGILLTRSAAVWENSKPVLGALVGLLVFGFSVAIFSVVKYGEVNITAGLKPAYGAMVNYLCPSEVAMAGTAHYLAYPWILCLIFETILVCLILPKAIGGSRLNVHFPF